VARPDFAAAAKGEEVKKNTMRKLFALVMAGLLTLALALAVVGCGGQKAAEETTPPAAETETTPPAETPAAADTAAMQDTTMAH
jgi:hypothetical protein